MLESRALSCGYGGATILHGLNLAFGAGERVALIGPNGSGKSTLLRCLSGLQAEMRIAGGLFLDGRPLQLYPRRELAGHLALVTQSLEVAFPISAWDYVAMGCYHRLDRLGLQQQSQQQAIEQAMAATATLDLAKRSVQNVSGGEWQRVRIAQALAQRPRYLLLDEPTAHLDVRVQLELLELLAQLSDQHGMTTIFSIHDLGLALRYSRRGLVLHQGRLLADGPTDDILEEKLLQTTFGVTFTKIQSENGSWIYPVSSSPGEDKS